MDENYLKGEAKKHISKNSIDYNYRAKVERVCLDILVLEFWSELMSF